MRPQTPAEPGESGPGESDGAARPKGFAARLGAMQGRTALLIAVGALLVLVYWGPLRSCSGVQVAKDEAVATALAEIDFEPERIDARLLRQGMSSTAWIVVFTIADPDGDRDEYLRHTAVKVDARTGTVTEVNVEVNLEVPPPANSG